MITKRGRRLQRYDLQLIMCGGMFKKILSQGEALKIVSYMEIVLFSVNTIESSSFNASEDIKIDAFEAQVEDAKVEKYQVDESEVDEVVVSEPQVYEVDVDDA
ncbi:hypothetical protein Tco_0906443 [Tanacetum coccineum]|uniref:Uncharacterized protein n=1 Tax=Tanacetum coccineum TaxID=301880 RepID=A0ABQ5CHI1_9ASTR